MQRQFGNCLRSAAVVALNHFERSPVTASRATLSRWSRSSTFIHTPPRTANGTRDGGKANARSQVALARWSSAPEAHNGQMEQGGVEDTGLQLLVPRVILNDRVERHGTNNFCRKDCPIRRKPKRNVGVEKALGINDDRDLPTRACPLA